MDRNACRRKSPTSPAKPRRARTFPRTKESAMKSQRISKIAAAVAMVFIGLMGATAWGAAQWANPDLLVDANTVKNNVDKPDWVVVDCRDLDDYAEGHIPGAISFGQECSKVLRDATSRAFSDVSKYERLLGKAGIGNNTHVVFYYGDIKDITSATVGFWIMEYLGHDKAHLLNGGLDAWRKAGNRLDNKPTIKQATTFKANLARSRNSPTDEIVQIATGKEKGVQLIDSRTPKEYSGDDIRALRGGHVPNATMNVSHTDTLAQEKNAKTGKMEAVGYLDPEAASKAFGSLDKNKRTVAYCQTGTRSTLTYLELRLMGFKDAANWDDSWRVYSAKEGAPVADEQWYDFDKVNKTMKDLESRLGKLEAAQKKQ
jgi:thiosulfate/3-mercaptopyruvate sulfurtransferase